MSSFTKGNHGNFHHTTYQTASSGIYSAASPTASIPVYQPLNKSVLRSSTTTFAQAVVGAESNSNPLSTSIYSLPQQQLQQSTLVTTSSPAIPTYTPMAPLSQIQSPRVNGLSAFNPTFVQSPTQPTTTFTQTLVTSQQYPSQTMTKRSSMKNSLHQTQSHQPPAPLNTSLYSQKASWLSPQSNSTTNKSFRDVGDRVDEKLLQQFQMLTESSAKLFQEKQSMWKEVEDSLKQENQELKLQLSVINESFRMRPSNMDASYDQNNTQDHGMILRMDPHLQEENLNLSRALQQQKQDTIAIQEKLQSELNQLRERSMRLEAEKSRIEQERIAEKSQFLQRIADFESSRVLGRESDLSIVNHQDYNFQNESVVRGDHTRTENEVRSGAAAAIAAMTHTNNVNDTLLYEVQIEDLNETIRQLNQQLDQQNTSSIAPQTSNSTAIHRELEVLKSQLQLALEENQHWRRMQNETKDKMLSITVESDAAKVRLGLAEMDLKKITDKCEMLENEKKNALEEARRVNALNALLQEQERRSQSENERRVQAVESVRQQLETKLQLVERQNNENIVKVSELTSSNTDLSAKLISAERQTQQAYAAQQQEAQKLSSFQGNLFISESMLAEAQAKLNAIEGIKAQLDKEVANLKEKLIKSETLNIQYANKQADILQANEELQDKLKLMEIQIQESSKQLVQQQQQQSSQIQQQQSQQQVIYQPVQQNYASAPQQVLIPAATAPQQPSIQQGSPQAVVQQQIFQQQQQPQAQLPTQSVYGSISIYEQPQAQISTVGLPVVYSTSTQPLASSSFQQQTQVAVTPTHVVYGQDQRIAVSAQQVSPQIQSQYQPIQTQPSQVVSYEQPQVQYGIASTGQSYLYSNPTSYQEAYKPNAQQAQSTIAPTQPGQTFVSQLTSSSSQVLQQQVLPSQPVMYGLVSQTIAVGQTYEQPQVYQSVISTGQTPSYTTSVQGLPQSSTSLLSSPVTNVPVQGQNQVNTEVSLPINTHQPAAQVQQQYSQQTLIVGGTSNQSTDGNSAADNYKQAPVNTYSINQSSSYVSSQQPIPSSVLPSQTVTSIQGSYSIVSPSQGRIEDRSILEAAQLEIAKLNEKLKESERTINELRSSNNATYGTTVNVINSSTSTDLQQTQALKNQTEELMSKLQAVVAENESFRSSVQSVRDQLVESVAANEKLQARVHDAEIRLSEEIQKSQGKTASEIKVSQSQDQQQSVVNQVSPSTSQLPQNEVESQLVCQLEQSKVREQKQRIVQEQLTGEIAELRGNVLQQMRLQEMLSQEIQSCQTTHTELNQVLVEKQKEIEEAEQVITKQNLIIKRQSETEIMLKKQISEVESKMFLVLKSQEEYHAVISMLQKQVSDIEQTAKLAQQQEQREEEDEQQQIEEGEVEETVDFTVNQSTTIESTQRQPRNEESEKQAAVAQDQLMLVDVMTTQIEELTKQVAALEEERSQLKASVGKLGEEVQSLKKTNSSLDKDLNDGMTALGLKLKEVAEITSAKDALASKVEGLQAEQKETQEKLKQALNKVDTLEKEIKSTLQVLEETKVQAVTSEKSQDEKHQEIVQLRKNLAQLREELVSAQKALELEKSERLREVQELTKKAQDEISQERSNFEARETTLKQVHDEFVEKSNKSKTEMEEKHASQLKELSAKAEAVEVALKASVESLNGDVTKSLAREEELKVQLSSARNESAQKSEVIEKNKESIVSLEKEVGVLKASVEESVAKRKNEGTEWSSKVESLETKLAAKSKAFDILAVEKSENDAMGNEEIQKLKENYEALLENEKNAKEEVQNKYVFAVDELKVQVAKAQADTKTAEANHSKAEKSLRNEIEGLKNLNEKKLQAMRVITDDYQKATAEIQTLKETQAQESAKQTEIITTLTSELSAQQALTQAVQSELAESKRETERTLHEIEEQRIASNKLSIEITHCQEQLLHTEKTTSETLSATIKQYESKLESLQKQYYESQTTEATVKDLHMKIDTIEREHREATQSLQTNLSTVEKALKESQNNSTSLEKEKLSLTSLITQLRDQADLDSRKIAELNTSIDGLKNEIKANAATIKTLEEEKSAKIKENESLSQKLAEITSNLHAAHTAQKELEEALRSKQKEKETEINIMTSKYEQNIQVYKSTIEQLQTNNSLHHSSQFGSDLKNSRLSDVHSYAGSQDKSMVSANSARSKEETRQMARKLGQMSMSTAAMMSFKHDYTSLKELAKNANSPANSQSSHQANQDLNSSHFK